MDKKKFILLVEDNPDDEALTMRALKQNHIDNGVVVARDGAEALDYLFGKGKYAGRDLNEMPALILLDSCAPIRSLRYYRWRSLLLLVKSRIC